ncbi:MAG: class I SAM-dependent methyltransferase [Oscillospiraceae bacterium]|nr:class I SAM-dependent methyltransferase [Oscillospiraceae bacterium]
MSYKEFSYFYDYFNYNADYDKLFANVVALAKEGGVSSGIMCDLGCGTGELAFRFNDAGFDVIAVDNSDEMLDVLFDKRDEIEAYNVQILKQDITQLDMFGTIDLFTCTFDTVNHLEGAEAVQKLFDKVSLFMDPDGVFVFDMNTKYKHLNILKNEVFDFIDDEADCHWQNTLYADENRTKISITINDKHAGEIYNEEFYEYYYELDDILEMLKKAGLQVKKLIDGESFKNVEKNTQRYMFMVKKELNNG